MKVLIALALAALATLVGGRAAAQDETRISSLTIKLWPEFDQPNMLVFYVGQAAGAPAATELRFNLPPNVTINAVAYSDTDGSLRDDIRYTQNGSELVVASPNGSFHIEFYDPALKIDGENRSYQVTWNSPHAVDQLDWYVQQPVGAGPLTLDPPSAEETTGEYGLLLRRVDGKSVAAGEERTLSVSYAKPDSQLTWDAIQQQPAPPEASAPSASGDSGQVTLIIVGVVVAVALGAAFSAYYFREVRGRAPGGKAARKDQGERYCSECGTLARPADKFCRKCGAKLRGA